MNIQSKLKLISHELATISPTAQLDAALLLVHVLKTNREYLYAHSEKQLTAEQEQQIATLLERRLHGEPIAYILGKREFWSLELIVDNSVLIPRPDTELLVELTLSKVKKEFACVADLGTGSGAIALALAKERPKWKIIATDASEAALKIASKNAQQNNIHNVEFYCGEWCQVLTTDDGCRLSGLDTIVANPPYIAKDDPHLQQGDVKFEPLSALVSDKDGLQDLTTIITQAADKLNPGGVILLEHGYAQAKAVQQLLQKAGFTAIETYQDLAGNDRVTLGYKSTGG